MLIVWILVNSTPTWYTIYSNKKVGYIPARDDKYAPFVRYDYKNWHYWLVPFTHFFMLPRWILGWCSFWFVTVVAAILMYGQDPKNPARWRRRLL